jgi:hypothetical protein
MEFETDIMTISRTKYCEMLTLINACCFTMGVHEEKDLFDAVKQADEAIKAFIQDNDGGKKIRDWWNSREF